MTAAVAAGVEGEDDGIGLDDVGDVTAGATDVPDAPDAPDASGARVDVAAGLPQAVAHATTSIVR